MIDQEVSKIITEKMGGGCWHEWKLTYSDEDGFIERTCVTCGVTSNSAWINIDHERPDWTSREKFLDLWDWARQQLWWWDFGQKHGWLAPSTSDPDSQPILLAEETLIAQPRFAHLVAEWLVKEE